MRPINGKETKQQKTAIKTVRARQERRCAFWRERRAGRCKAPRRRRCGDIVEERQRRRCPPAAAPLRAAAAKTSCFTTETRRARRFHRAAKPQPKTSPQRRWERRERK